MPITNSFMFPLSADMEPASSPPMIKGNCLAWDLARLDDVNDADDAFSSYSSDSCDSPLDEQFADAPEDLENEDIPLIIITPPTDYELSFFLSSIEPSFLDAQPWDFVALHAQLMHPGEAARLHHAACDDRVLRRHITQARALSRKNCLSVPEISPLEQMHVVRAQIDARADARARAALAEVDRAMTAAEGCARNTTRYEPPQPTTSYDIDPVTENDDLDSEVPDYVFDTPSSATDLDLQFDDDNHSSQFSIPTIVVTSPDDVDSTLPTSRNIPSIIVTPPDADDTGASSPVFVPAHDLNPALLDGARWDLLLYRRALANPQWASDLERRARQDPRLARQIAQAFAVARAQGIELPSLEDSARIREEAEERARVMADEWRRTLEEFESRQRGSYTAEPVPRRLRHTRGLSERCGE